MAKVLIVGAGQSGLQLALGLQGVGHDVTVASGRTPQEIRDGAVMSTQCMFGQALDYEREIGADLWASSPHRISALGATVPSPDGGLAVNWTGQLDQYAQSIDQRVKMSAWLERFADGGGHVLFGEVTAADLDRLAGDYDLTVVAAGKGDFAGMFERDDARSPFTTPQRALAVAYAHGVQRRAGQGDFDAVRLNLVGVGEFFVIPALTLSGPCDILFWEAEPGGELDVFESVRGDAQGVLNLILEKVRTHAPWEYERCRGAELTDARATLVGRYTPVVRHPVVELPSGALALGMADVVVACDPITGQGSNNASRFAKVYLDAIVAHGEQPFERAFMQGAFDKAYAAVETSKLWTDAMLTRAVPQVFEILGAAQRYQPVADRFANAFSDPDDFNEWLMDPAKAAAYLAQVAAEA